MGQSGYRAVDPNFRPNASRHHRRGNNAACAQPRVEGRCDVCGAGNFIRRADDRPDALQTRFAAYRNQTAPILPYYRGRGILQAVDGMSPIDEVSRQIEAILGGPAR